MPRRGGPNARGREAPLSGWSACGIITLMTDFGTRDPYVGMMKGVLLAHARDAIIVDVTHDVPAQDVRTGAWILKHSAGYFPSGTVHVAVVDPGVGSVRRLLVAHDRGHVFLAPDNGLLSPLLSREASVFELDAARFTLGGSSRTFHGRDVLAPAAAQLASGSAPGSGARARVHDWVELELARPIVRASGEVEGEVVLCDRYGNLVTNLTPLDLEGNPAADLSRWCIHLRRSRGEVKRLRAQVNGSRSQLSRSRMRGSRLRGRAGASEIPIRGTYAEAASGELLALVDSYGALEIAVRDGSVADVLRLGPGDAITARRLR